MLNHLNEKNKHPSKVLIVGATGFVGSAIKKRYDSENSTDCVGITRNEVDLLSRGASEILDNYLDDKTTLVVACAKAPCKNYAMMIENALMLQPICDAIQKQKPKHTVYISSDAVYADSMYRLSENSPLGAQNTHGMMHAMREVMLKDATNQICPLAILRPTLIYGDEDPHNGYGPNSFRRLAEKGEAITLFGKGEELRDHVSIKDVAEITVRVILRRSEGVLNIASGQTISFFDIATLTVANSINDVAINTTKRMGEMPHNGYRPFDESATFHAFPDFSYVPPREGMVDVILKES